MRIGWRWLALLGLGFAAGCTTETDQVLNKEPAPKTVAIKVDGMTRIQGIT